jgi:hypothetical protein
MRVIAIAEIGRLRGALPPRFEPIHAAGKPQPMK